MSSVSASKPIDGAALEPRSAAHAWRHWRPWPRSLFGRLLISVLAAVFLAQALAVTLVARERNRFVTEGNVREWSRRIVDLTYALEVLGPEERALARTRLERWPPEGPPRPRLLPPPADQPHDSFVPPGAPPVRDLSLLTPLSTVNFPRALEQLVQLQLGPDYHVAVSPTTRIAQRAISVTRQPPQGYELGGRPYDVSVGLPDGDTLRFRVAQGRRGPILPRNLVINLLMLTIATAIVLYIVARSITRPLSDLSRAAEAVGRDVNQPALKERGAQELREAARAFNTMHERMHRYVDSRTRVLAAMSHDLKTPLTRMRLRVETLGDPDAQERFGRDLDEMESMVRGALALLKNLSDDEVAVPVDVNALLATLQTEFAELGASVQIRGRARSSFLGKPQALKRCLTNLLSNAVHFGTRAVIVVEDGSALTLRVKDEGPGLPAEELERVFEPFYRVESSRNRDTGGTGLGLSIARDIAQAHGGSLVLRNLPERGLEAVLVLPRVKRP